MVMLAPVGQLSRSDRWALGGAVAVAACMLGLLVAFLTSSIGTERNSWDCGRICPWEPMDTAAPSDGLAGFGALLPVWDAHHRLEEAARWIPDAAYAGYLPQPPARARAFTWTLFGTGPGGRVDEAEADFWSDVSAGAAVALITPDLPPDTRPVPTPSAVGCASSLLFNSSLVRRVAGDQLIRVDLDPDMANGYMGRYTDATVRLVPANDPCEILELL